MLRISSVGTEVGTELSGHEINLHHQLTKVATFSTNSFNLCSAFSSFWPLSSLVANIYSNLPVNATVRLPHPWSGDSQGQERFLASSADKQTCNYDTECSNHHPSLSTLRPKGLSRSKMKW